MDQLRVCVLFFLFTSSHCFPVQELPATFHHDLAKLIPKLAEKVDSSVDLTYPAVLSSGDPAKIAAALPFQLWQSLRVAETVTPTATRGVIQNLFYAFAEAFQEIVNRQQSLLDLIYCRNCHNGASPWQNFLNAMANIPALGWVMRPNSESNGKPTGSFIAATNQNGVVSGVGGSIINNEPIVEYTFNNNHVTPVKPHNAVTKTPVVPTAIPHRLEPEIESEEVSTTPGDISK